MEVIKRSGKREDVSFDKITARIKKLCYDLDTRYIDYIEIAKKVIQGLYDGVTTTELDNLAAETAATMAAEHPEYAILAARIAVSNLHKNTKKSFARTMKDLYNYIDPKTGEPAGLIGGETFDIIWKHRDELDSAIIYDRDYSFDYFGFKTLERSYLLRMDGQVVERPQHMIMRTAVGIHGEDIAAAIETYNLISEKWFIHATPTLFNAGTPKPQLSSCFVAGTQVFTINDGPKKIENVQIGDLVVTHKGNVKPVVQTHKNPLDGRQIYNVKAYGSPSMKITGNHRFWSISKEQLAWGEKPQFNAIEYLREGDYIAIPDKNNRYENPVFDLSEALPTGYGHIQLEYEVDEDYVYPASVWERRHKLNPTDETVLVKRQHTPVKRWVTINEDFAELMGLWLGDGHIMLGRNADKTHQFVRGIGFAVYHEAYEMIGRITELCEKVFGIKPSVSAPNVTNTVDIHLSSHLVGNWVENRFGRGFSEKHLWREMFKWDRSMVTAFLQGLVTSDGCVTKAGDVRITMANVSLVKSIFALARNVGIPLSYSAAKTLKKGATKRTARVNLPKQTVDLDKIAKYYQDDRLTKMRDRQPLGSHLIEIEGIKFLRLSKKEKVDIQPEFVYTLGVEDDHSYVVEGLVAENCFLLSMTDDSISGIFETLSRCAKISQSAGGIGLSIHNIRATGSYIKGTGGTSNGIIPMLKVYNDTARYVDQCFHPDTIVYTKQGIKAIKQVAVDDELLTEDGSYDRVGRLLQHDYNGPMIELSVKQSIEPIRVTPEHPFLVLRNQQKMVNFDVIRNRLEKGYAQPEWAEAKELTENDLIVFPSVSDYERDIGHYSLEDCRMYGMMLGDGHVSKDGRQAHITMNLDTDDAHFIRSYMYKNGIPFTYSEEEGRKKIRFTWSAHLGFKFSRVMLYDEQGQKRIHHSMLHLPKDKTFQIIKGLMEADGCITSRNNFEMMLEMVSRNVIESIRFMLMRFGILTCGYVRDRRGNTSSYKNITTRQKTYVLRLPKVDELTKLFDKPAGKYVSFLNWNGYVFSRVNHIRQVNFKGVVVDFEVLPNHNYVTHVGVAHNGGGKRKGAFAVYLEPWHADVFEFLDLKKNHGKEELRARDLFYAMWIPDLFMERVKEDGEWSLFCPNEAPGLCDCHSGEFEALYHQYEQEGRARKVVRAQELWFAILESQIETGTPYILYKDAANRKSNQKNLGTIRSSNLCTEIMEYTSPDEVAVCNLASIALPRFVDEESREFDFRKLFEISRVVTRNLNKVIDINYYPIPEARNSNMRHRPIGIGVQGLADAFIMMRHPFDSPEARQLNRDIFETIYFAALTESCALAERDGHYETFPGSPASKGELQYDMWGAQPSDRWDWAGLKKRIKKHGLRNSLLLAPMPTASTSQILGNNECFEPYTSNIYTRRTLSGEFIVVNKHLLHDLIGLGLWNEEMKHRLMAANGSIQEFDDIPQDLRDLYKTVWEISQKAIIDMAAGRGAFICQSQSMNLFLQDPNFGKLSSMHFYAWQKGLKTGMYYLRSKAATDPIKFTVKQPAQNKAVPAGASESAPESANGIEAAEGQVCKLDDPDCLMCGA